MSIRALRECVHGAREQGAQAAHWPVKVLRVVTENPHFLYYLQTMNH